MSSATSINPPEGPASGLGAGSAGKLAGDDSTMQPWQFFLLAGMLAATAVVIVATGQSRASIVILSLTVVAASLVAIGAYRALVPLVLPDGVLPASMFAGGRSRARLEREKSLVLRTIKELEFDFAMGKISQVDYTEMGGRLRARAMRLIRQLDAGGGYKAVIEQELQARIGTMATIGTGGTEVLASGTSIPDDAATPTTTMEGGTSVVSLPLPVAACASCGTPNDADARFCKNCGSRLAGAA